MAKFLEFLNSEENENELAKDFNKDLIYNLRSEPLVGFVLKAFNIIESKYLKLVSWELITDESKFDSYKVNTKYIKNKKNKKFDKRLPIKESRFDLLKLKFRCATDEKTWFEDREVLLYKQIDNLYYIIEGNRYCPIYQLVDASVYNRKNYLTLKSQSSPIILKRDVEEIKDVENNNYKIQYYRICLSKQKINILYFYLGLMGYENTIKFMQMVNIIKIEPFRKYNKEEEYCFMSNSNLYIKVIKYFFDNDTFTRYMVTALLYVMEDCETMDDLYNNEIWTAKLGALITKEDQEFDKKFYKGKSFLLTFHSFLDKITKDSLRLKSYNKSSTFALVRWMLRNFNELKMLDNMDIANKRIRFGEHMVAPLVRRLNQRKRKFVTDITSNKIKQYHVTDLINMDQDFVIKTISGSKSSLLKYDDTVNDCDLFTAIKFSLKGPNSIGENNSNSVSVNNRDIHPSYVGSLGINFTSTSDPGMSGVLTPFVKLYNKYFFSDKKEPESWDENFNRLYKNYFKGENLPVHELNYFYSLEKQTRKKLKLLDSIDAFIEDDPYIGTKKDVIDPKKNKCRVVKVRHLDERRGIPSTPFIESKKKYKTRKKKRGRKKKNTDGLKHIHVSRIK